MADSTRTTIHDVATAAGVSPATVSRVLNGTQEVSPSLAKKVRQAVLDLEYRPNALARSLRRQSAAVWQLVISDIENPFFTAMVRGVEDVAQASECSVVLCNTDENPEKERRYIQVAIDERMSGVIIAPASRDHTDIEPLLRHGIPVVTVDRELAHNAVDAVVVDNVAGGRTATAELVAGGYRRIGCITGPLDTTTGAGRLAGYLEALRIHGLSTNPQMVQEADFREAGGLAAMRSLFESPDWPAPDAVFISNNRMTMGALAYLNERSFRVPDDVGLVGFDDLPWARFARTPITTISQPTYAIGKTAAELLGRRRRERTAPVRRVVLEAQLERRMSSTRPPG